MIIIPAIDILGGKCVRLTKGDYSRQKVYHDDPLEFAMRMQQAGITHLHVVDLDGAKANQMVNAEALRKICSGTALQVDFGGGIKTDAAIEKAFDCGAAMVTVGSIAVKNKPLFLKWLRQYGPDKIILGADVNNGKIAISGWLENSDIDLFEFLETYIAEGVQQVICTDISKDGMLQGSAIQLYQSVLERFPKLKLIASGGVNGMDELHELKRNGLYGAIVGKAIYEGNISLSQIAGFNQALEDSSYHP